MGKAGPFQGTVPWGLLRGVRATSQGQGTQFWSHTENMFWRAFSILSQMQAESQGPRSKPAGWSFHLCWRWDCVWRVWPVRGASRLRTRTGENAQDCFRWNRRWAKRKDGIHENVKIDGALKLRFRDFFFHFCYFYFLFPRRNFNWNKKCLFVLVFWDCK